MGWTEQEYNAQRIAFVNQIGRAIKKEDDQAKKANKKS